VKVVWVSPFFCHGLVLTGMSLPTPAVIVTLPSVPMSYSHFFPEATRQATMTGSEHRRALPFLPFGVVGVAGALGDDTGHQELTKAVCELVVVTNVLFAARCTGGGGGILYSEAVVLAKKAHEWVINSFQSLLGPAHTTKLHRMSAHLLDEFRLRGNVGDGNTPYNEMLHKFVKAAYKLTNRSRGQFVEQLVVTEKLLTVLREEKEGEDEGETASNKSYSATCSDGQRRRRHRRRRLRRRRKYDALQHQYKPVLWQFLSKARACRFHHPSDAVFSRVAVV